MADRRRIAMVVVSAVSVIFFVVGFFLGRPLIQMLSMDALPTQQAVPGVYAVKTSTVNLFLVECEGGYIAFDAGADAKAVGQELEGLGISPEQVLAVFLTHTDYDHVDALPLFSQATIYMSQSNADFLDPGRGSRDRSFKDMELPYEALPDGGAVTVGGVEVRCIFTPGHTDGSACYIVDGRYLFVGDTLSLARGEAALFVAFFNEDDDEQALSLRKLAGLQGIEYIFTMHFGMSDDFEQAFARWRD